MPGLTKLDGMSRYVGEMRLVPLAVVTAVNRGGKGFDHLSWLRLLDLDNPHYQSRGMRTLRLDGDASRLQGLRFQREFDKVSFEKSIEPMINGGDPRLDPVEKPVPSLSYTGRCGLFQWDQGELHRDVVKRFHLCGHPSPPLHF
jgi:hypothetical protein